MSYRAKTNYKRLGNYIELVDERNVDLEITLLLGLSISKHFIPSVANIIGSNMKNYKIIRKGQFACSIMQVRRDGKMPVALLEEYDEAIISQAYPVFQVIDESLLLPEYLMMWFSRSEFDRQATFHAVGGVRGSLEWEDFMNFELPIPSIEKQNEIVREYNTIVNRIELNETINQKLEETAQALYKHWFVDFEFPNEDGEPYKSSGGEMVYCEDLEAEIPKGWKYDTIASMSLDISDGNYSSKYPKSSEFLKAGIPFVRGTDFKNKCISPHNLLYISPLQHSKLLKGHTKKGDILISTRGDIGQYCFVTSNFEGVNINAQLVRINGREKYPTLFLGCLLNSRGFKEEIKASTTGSALKQLPRKNLSGLKLIVPTYEVVQAFTLKYGSLLKYFLLVSEENHCLTYLSTVLLSKMSKIDSLNNKPSD